jgi:hypothetical protein
MKDQYTGKESPERTVLGEIACMVALFIVLAALFTGCLYHFGIAGYRPELIDIMRWK